MRSSFPYPAWVDNIRLAIDPDLGLRWVAIDPDLGLGLIALGPGSVAFAADLLSASLESVVYQALLSVV